MKMKYLHICSDFRVISLFCCFSLCLGFLMAATQFQLNTAYAQEATNLTYPQQMRKSQTIQIGEYNGSGIIDAVHKKSIIVNDTLFHLSPILTTFDLKGRRIYKQLEKDLYIYYFLDDQSRITEIYIGD
jgi:hypothetical protein